MTDELTEFILDMLPTNGYITYDCIVQDWLDVAAIKVGVRLKELKAEGRITCSPDGVRWQSKFTGYPVTEEVLSNGVNRKETQV